jgi:hypothetical protein
MNKQEKEDLIQALYDIGGCDAEDEWSRGYDDGVNAAIEVVKEIKVQEKAIVPKFLAYWFEDNFEELDWELGGVLINAFNTNRSERSDFQDWLVDTTNYPIETLIRMKLFGYEVEEEPLYYVVFDILHSQKYLVKNVKTNQFYLSNNEKVVGNYEQVRFTEQEIKDIGQGYWYFKKKVENK